jgi:hypothetical protein
MPHRRHAHDDRHSYAAASRFLDDSAVAAMDILEDRPTSPAMRSPATASRVGLPTLDELWT